jgi:hypothetical protein
MAEFHAQNSPGRIIASCFGKNFRVLPQKKYAGLTACIGGHGLAGQRTGSRRWYLDRRMQRLPFGSVMHPERPALRPPVVERPAADAEIGAYLSDGEAVPLSAVADFVRAGA